MGQLVEHGEAPSAYASDPESGISFIKDLELPEVPIDLSYSLLQPYQFNYEITNFRGDVQAVVTADSKTACTGEDEFTAYLPQIQTVTDYYSFGSPMSNRTDNQQDYRFGFNGKENDGETDTQDYGFRIYNPSLGRFLSLDPLAKQFVWNSPYAFAENDVIRCIDLEGAEKFVAISINIDIMTPTGPTKFTVNALIDLPENGAMGNGGLTVVVTNGKVDWYYIHSSDVIADKKLNLFERIVKKVDSWLGRGGINFTSSDGKGSGTKGKRKGTIDVNTENIDMLVAVVSGLGGMETPGLKNFDIDDIYELYKKFNSAAENTKKIDDHYNGVDHDFTKTHIVDEDTFYKQMPHPANYWGGKSWEERDTIIDRRNEKTIESLEKNGWHTDKKAAEKHRDDYQKK